MTQISNKQIRIYCSNIYIDFLVNYQQLSPIWHVDRMAPHVYKLRYNTLNSLLSTVNIHNRAPDYAIRTVVVFDTLLLYLLTDQSNPISVVICIVMAFSKVHVIGLQSNVYIINRLQSSDILIRKPIICCMVYRAVVIFNISIGNDMDSDNRDICFQNDT